MYLQKFKSHTKLLLSFSLWDIEVNPGDVFVNPHKTIHAHFWQGKIEIFGQNAGRQCVATSPCSLIYFVPGVSA